MKMFLMHLACVWYRTLLCVHFSGGEWRLYVHGAHQDPPGSRISAVNGGGITDWLAG